MTKKILAFLLVLVLAVGTLTLTATATSDSDAYEVGYAKVDINPYWKEWINYSAEKTLNATGEPWPNRGQIPEAYQNIYSEYDMLPLPMGGYGNNSTRLSRPKLMDDNGSGAGAGTTKESFTSNGNNWYLKSGTTWTRATSNSTNYPAVFTRSGNFITGYTYSVDPDYQDVHLDDNRYTEAFAKKLLGNEGAAGYYETAGGWGDNDGDGVWATCVLVKDPQSDSPMLIISLDNISIDAALVNIAKTRILAKLPDSGLTEDRIMINANHTHGSVALGTQYSSSDTDTLYYLAENYFGDNISFTEQEMWCFLNFYKNYMCNQLANAALAAYNDMETALTMEKGTIDVSTQTGYQLNGVRHNVQTYTPTSGEGITYVRGSSFNNDVNGDGATDPYAGGTVTGGTFTKSRPVTASNDNMQILKFTFENKEPIAMVNFRAHATANNKQAAKLLHYNISADWVSPLRYDMENAKTLGFDDTDYRFTLLYGNSGNLGTGLSNGDDDPIISSYANYVEDRDGVSRWQLPATPHGRLLAQAALALLKNDGSDGAIREAMHEVKMGPIVSVSRDFTVYKQQWTDLQYAAALKYRSQYESENATVTVTIADGETVTYGSNSITLATGGSYTIASKYHARGIIGKYTSSSTEATIELNAFRWGNAVAFSTNSIEASERYFAVPDGLNTNTIPEAAVNALNDWNKLVNASWGTPFDLSLTNDSDGYIPNSLAYIYNSDTTNTNYTLATGSYESQTSYAVAGSGELMVQALSEMMAQIQPKITKQCQACGNEKEWLPLTTGVYNNTTGGHYYLDGDFADAGEMTVPAGQTVCLELNGATLTAAGRAFKVNGTLNIQGSGTLQGTAVADKNGGTVYVAANGTVNQYSGALTCDHASQTVKSNNGGVVYVEAGGNYTMLGGTITGGCAATGGGNVYTCGAFTMKGGSISEGTAASYGGNVHAQGASAVFTMTGGAVIGGDGSSNICTGPNKTEDTSVFRMEGGSVVGEVYVQGKAVLTGTTNGTVNITSKVPAERLTIEGTYTGTINLTVHGASSVATGEKIGISDNADISGATIAVTGATATQYVAVVDNALQVTEYAVTGISVTAPTKTEYWVDEALDTTGMVVTVTYANGHTTQITDGFALSGFDSATAGTKTVTVTYEGQSAAFAVTVKKDAFDYYVGDVGYDDLNTAMEHSTSEHPVVLEVNVTQAVTMTRDVYLDLNGHSVAAVNTNGYKLHCLDSQTDDYDVADGVYGTITDADANVVAVDGYMTITEGNKTSYHKLTWGLTHLVVNTERVGLTYKANFQGDQKVKAQIREFGVAVRAYRAPDTNSIWMDTECRTHMALGQSDWQVGKNTNTVKCVYVTNILLDSQEVDNQQRAQIEIYGICYIKLQDGTMLYSTSCKESLHSAMEYMNSLWDTPYLTADDQANLQKFYTEWEDVMSGWTDIGNIKGKNEVDIPVV